MPNPMHTDRPQAGHALVITRVLDAPPDLVFEAWTSADHLQRWWYPRQDGRDFVCTSFEMDFRVGGAYRYSIRSPQGQDYPAHGTYLEIAPGRRLVFTFQWDGPASPQTLIAVDFEALAGARTRLTFTQEAFADAADRDSHESGWSDVLDRLAEALAVREKRA
ncbi:SRPBCC family protein [Ramlibacter tataouinensis]|uniref:Activator of Hsp90 ATPase homologue 1/2-like C-terminal domain-containing protein n=1 Tax=Ramlibacter tataouinensis (strain ATCC BAA-407 / DSM 14655 / LMG 21543 / TTB310) TaxID=365046 RepID=F5XXL8_RAMTT|nr:SRPBCC domain-containing protein [Ramlibacter tataouinensis]AEG91821.1 Conserved hypothetical protein [Ramlibacter tataouinensis TTB310]